MRADAECLILEDDPVKLVELKNSAISAGFHPMAVRSPSDALRILKHSEELARPVMAIIDRDMTMAPDQSRSSMEVLRYLSDHFDECTVLVYSANISGLEAQMEIMQCHARALLHDKRTGDEALFKRIQQIMNKRRGDLIIEHAAIRHIPTGDCEACKKGPGADRHGHWVAVALLMKCPQAVYLKNETMTRAARRFNDWLNEHKIHGEVQALGKRMYCLKIDAE